MGKKKMRLSNTDREGEKKKKIVEREINRKTKGRE